MLCYGLGKPFLVGRHFGSDEDARAFAAKWAACAHVTSVTIHQGRALLETIKPQTHD
jgi:hypothetical protein